MSVADLSESPPFRPWPKDAEVLTHKGGCHCGKFKYEFQHPDIAMRKPMACNCSICAMKGELHLYADSKCFTFTKGSFSDALTYEWGPRRGTRYFCPACGVAIVLIGMGKAGVNARTLDEFDADKTEVDHYDGRNKEK